MKLCNIFEKMIVFLFCRKFEKETDATFHRFKILTGAANHQQSNVQFKSTDFECT